MGNIVAAQYYKNEGDGMSIMAVDISNPKIMTEIAVPKKGRSLQYYMIGNGHTGYYDLPIGGNVNLTPDKAVLVVDDLYRITLPINKNWNDGIIWKCNWFGAVHATFLPDNQILHAAVQNGYLFGLGFLPVTTWGLLKTDIHGAILPQVGGRSRDGFISGAAEPHCRGNMLTYTHNGVVVGGRIFASMGGVQFDPVISPDGKQVVWLERVKMAFPARWQLCVGNLTTGESRVIVPYKDEWLNSNAHWLDDNTLIHVRRDPTAPIKHWAIYKVNIMDGVSEALTDASHGNFQHVVPI